MRNDFDVRHFNSEFQVRKRIVIDAREGNPLVSDLTGMIKQKMQLPESSLAVDAFFGEVIPHVQGYKDAGFSTLLRMDGNEYYFPYFGRLKIHESIAGYRGEKLPEPHNDVTDVPLLEINDPVAFCNKLVELETVVLEKSDLPWFVNEEEQLFKKRVNHSDVFSRIWYSATPHDYQNPIQFLERTIAFTKDRSLLGFKEERDFGSLSALKRNLVVSQIEMPSKFDAPFALAINLRSSTIEEHSGVLPQVIYGIDNSDGKRVVYIHAVQMPKIETLDEEQLKKNREILNTLVESNSRHIKTFVINHSDIYKMHFGDLPPELMKIEDPIEFIKEFYANLRRMKPDLFDEHGGIREGVLMDLAKQYSDQFSDAFLGIREMSFLDRAIEKINIINLSERDISERKKLLRPMYKLDADLKAQPVPEGLEKDQKDKIIGENEYIQDLKEVFRPAIVSLTAALAVFQKEGIYEVVVPVYSPLRWQHHVSRSGVEESERIHRNINEGLVRLFNRVAFQIQGMEIQSVSDEDGFLRIKITDDLRSNNPILQEVITQITQ